MDLAKIKFESKDKKFYNIRIGRNKLKYKIKKVLCPFGLENEYNNNIIKIELDNENENHINFISLINNLNEKITENFGNKDNELKNNFRLRKDKFVFNCRLKKFKNNILVNINYNNKDDYLKTIYDLNKMSLIDAELELDNLWDFRENEQDNKLGYLININNITVH